MFDKGSFDTFSGGSISIPLTEKEGALISSALFYMLTRSNWQAMSDTDWDSWNSYLAGIIEKVSP